MKHWLKRGLSLILSLALCLQLGMLPSRAAQTVYFTAANDRVMDLNTATMPFMQNGMFYLSQNIFSNTGLGIYYSRSKTANTVSLYTGGNYLTFYLDSNITSDSQGTEYSYRLIVKGDTVFFPMNLLTGYFGLTYSILQTDYAPIIRVQGGSDNLSDRVFLDAAKNMLGTYYARYQKALAEENAASSPPPEEPAPQGLYPICPTVAVSDLESCCAILEQLDSRQWGGLFLFRPEELSLYADLLRRIVAGGHSIGFVGVDLSAQQLQQANQLLFLAAGCKSRAVLTLETDAAGQQALQQAGYCLLQPDGDYSRETLKNSSASNRLLQNHRQEETSLLLLGSSAHVADSAAIFFNRLQANRYYCQSWRVGD